MNGLKFDEPTARELEVLYGRRDVLRRRQLVREALGGSPGERIMDVGCGPGFYVAELLDQVGSDGFVVGIDNSQPMLALAAHRSAGHDNVAFHEADATSLPVETASFHRLVSVQVLEYVGDVPAALTEMHRALGAGGRLVLWDVDWATLSLYTTDSARTERILRAWDGHLAHRSLPQTLTAQLPCRGIRRRQGRRPHLRDQPIRPGDIWWLPRSLHRAVRCGARRDLRRRGSGMGSRAARLGAKRRVLLRLHPVLLQRDALW